MKILFFGDIVGRPGREAVLENVNMLRKRYGADVCIANCENAAGGFGITREHAETLLRAGMCLQQAITFGLKKRLSPSLMK